MNLISRVVHLTRTQLLVAAVLMAVLVASLLPARTALAQDPNQVTGLTILQYDGFTRLAWNPVAGATDYEIERTPLMPGTEDPSGPAVIVGLWFQLARSRRKHPPSPIQDSSRVCGSGGGSAPGSVRSLSPSPTRSPATPFPRSAPRSS